MTRQLDSLRAFVGERSPHAWRRIPHVVVVAGGKGGVGASTVSVLVAAGAARAGHATLLVDASGGNASLAALLGADAADDRTHAVAPRLSLAGVPAPHDRSAAERRASLRRLSAGYADHELVVIDAGATCDGVSAAVAAGAGRLLALANDDRLSLAATYALVKLAATRFDGLPIHVLINRSAPAAAGTAFGHVATAVEQFLAGKVMPAGSIPDDDTLGDLVEAGRSLLTADGPAAHAAALLTELLMHAGRDVHGRHVALQATI